MKRTSFYFILVWILLYIGRNIPVSGIILTISLLTHNIYYLSKSIKENNGVLFLIYLFMITYSLPLFSYYFLDEPISKFYNDAESTEYVYDVGIQLLLFHIIFAATLKFRNKFKIDSFKNKYIYTICAFLSICCIIISRGGNIFVDGGYHNSLEIGGKDSILEYGIIFISLSLLHAKTKVKLYIVYCIAFLFIVKNLLSGGRIETMSLCLAFYCIKFQHSLSLKATFIIISIGFVLMTLWGFIRTAGNIDTFVNADSFAKNANGMDVYYSSMRINYLIDRELLGIKERIVSLFLFIVSTIMSYSNLPALANLSSFMQFEYKCGGGGLISTFFYAWGGYLGIILIALFISTCLNKSNKDKVSPYWKFYSILLVATLPRWFAYYPIFLFKFCLYGVVIFYIFRIAKKTNQIES